ncbi:MAG: hypothetical protein WKF30_19090 [Pyrinomonadaceae bacterium]
MAEIELSEGIVSIGEKRDENCFPYAAHTKMPTWRQALVSTACFSWAGFGDATTRPAEAGGTDSNHFLGVAAI